MSIEVDPASQTQGKERYARLGVRPQARGKFLFVGETKLYVRGVTYGSFQQNKNGEPYPQPEIVEQDFAQMAANGINAVRTYEVAPRWFLDAAALNGLYVMVGIPWEQHITFLNDKGRPDSIERQVRAAVRSCSDHPAVLCYLNYAPHWLVGGDLHLTAPATRL